MKTMVKMTALAALAATLATAGNKAKITLTDGSVIHGEIPAPAVTVETIFGTVEIPVDTITGIKVANETNAAPGDHDPRLVYWNTFDSEEETRNPKAGQKTVQYGGTFVPGRVGNALHTQGKTDVVAFFVPPFVSNSGCVEFWAKLETDTDTMAEGKFPRFLQGGKDGAWSSFKMEYRVNNGMGGGGFYVSSVGVYGTHRFGQAQSYKHVLGEHYTGWHHYAFVWDNVDGLSIPNVEGRPHAAIFINGVFKCIQSFPAEANHKPVMTRLHTTGLEMVVAGSFTSGGNNLPFAIDELKIWNYAKTEFELHD